MPNTKTNAPLTFNKHNKIQDNNFIKFITLNLRNSINFNRVKTRSQSIKEI